MAYTSHGHYIIGTKKSKTPRKFQPRCHGAHGCRVCEADIADYWKKNGAAPTKERPVDVIGAGDLTRFKTARTIVENYIVQRMGDDLPSVKIESYVMKFTALVDSWKALLTSNVDDYIYEVVYLANLKVAQIAVFSKIDSDTIQDLAD